MDKLHTFYSSRTWRELAQLMKVKAGGRCCKCGEIIEDYSKLIAHHSPIELTEENVDDAMISLNPDNIEIVCSRCHNKEHRRYGGYVPKHVYIVYGPPLSGKTSYVRQVTKKGDLILDIDALWAAITFQPDHVKPNRCKYNVFPLRDLLYDQIKTRYGQWIDAYVIGGYADRFERERIAKELGAELIYCEATKEECLERAKARPAEYVEYIEKWFETYERTGEVCLVGAT